jgi:alpha-glucosidase
VLAPSQIGEAAVFARRSGKRWFLACMNGDHPRTMDIPLAFLGEGSWQAQTVNDVAGQAAALALGQATLTARDAIHLALGPGGGYVAEFERR